MNNTATDPRQVVWVFETSLTEHGYIPSIVTENQPGHSPLSGNGEAAQPWYWGHDLGKAREIAAEYNARMGYDPDAVREVLTSSFAAHHDAEGHPARKAAGMTLDPKKG